MHIVYLWPKSRGPPHRLCPLRSNLTWQALFPLSIVRFLSLSLNVACWWYLSVVLSLFARIANVQNVDPAQMQRHRRASSVSSQLSDRESFLRSRSNSRTSIQRSPIVIASSPSGFSVLDSVRGSPPVPTVIEPLSLNRTASRRSINLKKEPLG